MDALSRKYGERMQVQHSALYPLAVLGVGVGLFVLNLWRNRFFLHDDAFISLKYAQNLVAHGELSWNLGDHVEGYTNFLYVLLTAGLIRLGVDPVVALHVLNGLAVILLICAVYHGARHLFPDDVALQALAVTLALGNVALAVWVYGGLEAPLAAAFVGWGAAFIVAGLSGDRPRSYAAAGICLALAVLTRPDGVIIVAAAAIAVFLAAEASWRARFIAALLVGGMPFVAFMIHLAWRVGYYGDVVPNTFHAKVGLDLWHRLGKVPEYLAQSALLYMPVIICAVVASAVALWKGHLTRAWVVLFAICISFAAYIIWSGGDHMAAARVFLPALVPAALLCVAALGTLPSLWRFGVSLGLIGLLCLGNLNARSFRMDWAAFNGTIVGRYINDSWPAGSLVGLNTAGSTPYFGSAHRYIDMLGLNDRSIAMRDDVPMLARRQAMPGHGKGDGGYVLSREPDYIILGGSEGIDVADADKWFLTGVELRALPDFAACYQMNRVALPVPTDLQPYRPDAGPVTFTYYEKTCD